MGIVRPIRRWWTSASARIKSGRPRSRSARLLAAAPSEPRRRVGNVADERKNALGASCFSAQYSLSDHSTVRVERNRVRRPLGGDPRVLSVVGSDIPDEVRGRRRIVLRMNSSFACVSSSE